MNRFSLNTLFVFEQMFTFLAYIITAPFYDAFFTLSYGMLLINQNKNEIFRRRSRPFQNNRQQRTIYLLL